MDTIILYRIGGEGPLQVVLDDEGDMAVFNPKSATAYAGTNDLLCSGQAAYQLIDVDI